VVIAAKFADSFPKPVQFTVIRVEGFQLPSKFLVIEKAGPDREVDDVANLEV